jgi:hypothetical protein
MEKMSNKANLAIQAVKLHPVYDLTSRKENSPAVEEDKMALLAFSAL